MPDRMSEDITKGSVSSFFLLRVEGAIAPIRVHLKGILFFGGGYSNRRGFESGWVHELEKDEKVEEEEEEEEEEENETLR